jgi:hypothetical protein
VCVYEAQQALARLLECMLASQNTAVLEPHWTQSPLATLIIQVTAHVAAVHGHLRRHAVALCAQVMSHSMVSPGFWCQAPKALVPAVGTKDQGRAVRDH